MPPLNSPTLPSICLTGGIATGKSRIGEWFKEEGWTVICSDEIVHSLYGPGKELSRLVSSEFGKDTLSPDGSVNRKILGSRVFGKPDAMARLNALVHPHVIAEWKQQRKTSLAAGNPTLVIIPLAYETSSAREFEQVWVAACTAPTQHARMRERGLNDDNIRQRLAAQWPLQKKIDLADAVIWTDGPWERTAEQLAILSEKHTKFVA